MKGKKGEKTKDTWE